MRLLFFLFGLMVVSLHAKESNRTWTSADGRTIEARFIDEKKGKVRIRRADGRVFNIPLDNLSEEDQKYVRSLAVAKLSPINDQKVEIEDTDSKPIGNDVIEYGSKPNYFVKSALDLEMNWVEPGTFMMGQAGVAEPVHQVTLPKGFYLGKYEVTQKQYEKVMGHNPSRFKGDKLPVERVNWKEAVAFCEALNKKEQIPRGWKFALPKEAEWEYACRAGTTTAYSWGDNISASDAIYHESFFQNKFWQPTNVGSYSANPWGFFDMHGNVCEWTADCHDASRISSTRVYRGGSWDSSRTTLRSAHRNYTTHSSRISILGFRVIFQQVE